MVAIHKLKGNRQVFRNQLIHLVGNGLLLLASGLMVEHIAYFALLTLDVGVLRPLTTKHANHDLIEQMLRRMGWRKLLFVMSVQLVSLVLHLNTEFKDSTRIRWKVHLHHTVFLQVECGALIGQQIDGLHITLRHLEIIEGMARNGYSHMVGLLREVDNHKDYLFVLFSQERIMTTRIEALRLRIDVHEVEEIALAESPLAIGHAQHPLIDGLQALLLLGKKAAIVVAPTKRVDTPVIENRGATVAAREALGIHATLAKLLTGIHHERVAAHQSRNHHARNGLTTIATEEIAGYALLIVVLEEVEHVFLDVGNVLPVIGDAACRTAVANDVAHTIVHAHLVVKVIEPRAHIGAILLCVIHLANEHHLRMAPLHDAGGIAPKLMGHHLRHVAPETIDVLRSPIEQDVGHLGPRAWNRIVVIATTSGVAIVHAIVELHGLVPIAYTWPIVETVVTGALGGILHIRLLAFRRRNRAHERLPRTVIEIVTRGEMHVHIILLAQVGHTSRTADRVIFARHMVGNEVDNDLHAHIMDACHELLKLLHAIVHINRDVGVNVVIVSNSVGRSRQSFHNGGMLTRYPILAVVCCSGVANNTREPHMGKSHVMNTPQMEGIQIIHLPHPILQQRTIGLTRLVLIAKEAGKKLIYDNFLIH